VVPRREEEAWSVEGWGSGAKGKLARERGVRSKKRSLKVKRERRRGRRIHAGEL